MRDWSDDVLGSGHPRRLDRHQLRTDHTRESDHAALALAPSLLRENFKTFEEPSALQSYWALYSSGFLWAGFSPVPAIDRQFDRMHSLGSLIRSPLSGHKSLLRVQKPDRSAD